MAIDVRREEDHARLVQATLERFGRIDALIVCAGILRKRGTAPKLAVDVGVDEWDDVMAVNLRGVFLANRAVLPTLVAQRSGLIVNLSSVQGLQGRAYDSAYCASKFGVIGPLAGDRRRGEELRRQGPGADAGARSRPPCGSRTCRRRCRATPCRPSVSRISSSSCCFSRKIRSWSGR